MQTVITERECPICECKMSLVMNNLYECAKCGTQLANNGRRKEVERQEHEERID